MPAATFIVLHGEDEFSLDEEVARLRAELDGGPNAGLNTTIVEGSEASVSEILSAVEAYPFLAESRVVIARGLLAHLTRKGAGETGKKGIELLVQALRPRQHLAGIRPHPVLLIPRRHENPRRPSAP